MAADLHDKLGRRTGQELILAKRPPASMGSDPGIFWLGGYNILVTSFVRRLYRRVDAGQPRNLLDMPI